MPRGFFGTFFPSSHDSVSRLRQSATDAVNDFSDSAQHQSNGMLSDLADRFGPESRAALDRATNQLSAMARVSRDLARQHPLTCLAAAVALGWAIGWLSGFATGCGQQRPGGRKAYSWNRR